MDFAIDELVASYLEKRGYDGEAESLRKKLGETNNVTASLSHENTTTNTTNPSDNNTRSPSGQLFNALALENATSKVYVNSYIQLQRWIDNSLDIYRLEYTALLFPIFVHIYLELIKRDYNEDARRFFQEYSTCHAETYYKQEILSLSSVTTIETMKNNIYCQEVLENCSFHVTLSRKALELLYLFLNDREMVLILCIFNERISIETTKQPALTQRHASLIDLKKGSIKKEKTKTLMMENNQLLHSMDYNTLNPTLAFVESKSEKNSKSSSSSSSSSSPVVLSCLDLQLRRKIELKRKYVRTFGHADSYAVATLDSEENELVRKYKDPNCDDSDTQNNNNNNNNGEEEKNKNNGSIQKGDPLNPTILFARGHGSSFYNNFHPIAKSIDNSNNHFQIKNYNSTASNMITAKLKDDTTAIACSYDDNAIRLFSLVGPSKEYQVGNESFSTVTLKENIKLTDDNDQDEKEEDDDKAKSGNDMMIESIDGKGTTTTTTTTNNNNNNNNEYENSISSLQGENQLHRPKRVTLRGHSKSVYSLDYLYGNQYLLSGSGDGTIRLWDTYVGTSLKTGGQSNNNPSNNYGLTSQSAISKGSTNEGCLAIYDSHRHPVWTVSSSFYDINTFASGSHDRTARLWTAEYKQPIRLFIGHYSDVSTSTFHPVNPHLFATGSWDKSIRLWDIRSGKTIRIFNGFSSAIGTTIFSPCGQYLAASGTAYDNRILIFDLISSKILLNFSDNDNNYDNFLSEQRGEEIKQKQKQKQKITSLSFSYCGSVLASGDGNGCIKLWDIKRHTTTTTTTTTSSPHQNNKYNTNNNSNPNLALPSFKHPLYTKARIKASLLSPLTEATSTFTRCYTCNHSAIFDLQYTDKNILLGVGPALAI